MTAEQLKGKKMCGFKFEGVVWNSHMTKLIGKVRIIDKPWDGHGYNNMIGVQFEGEISKWYYPMSQIEKHLVEESPVDLPDLFKQIKSIKI